MSLRIPNSSFILLLRRRSIKLWAVLRATFRLAAVLPLLAFRLTPAVVDVPSFSAAEPLPGEDLEPDDLVALSASCAS